MISQTERINQSISNTPENNITIICFSHVRWDSLNQQAKEHFKSLSKYNALYFIEEPALDASKESYYFHLKKDEKLYVVVPHLLPNITEEEAIQHQQMLLDDFMSVKKFPQYIFWYYNSVAHKFSSHYNPMEIIHDSSYLTATRSRKESYKVA
jgi:UDP-galactopyranose mutase